MNCRGSSELTQFLLYFLIILFASIKTKNSMEDRGNRIEKREKEMEQYVIHISTIHRGRDILR